MINVREISELELKKIYFFRYTNKFINEFKQMKSLLEELESKQDKKQEEQDAMVILYFIMGKMKEVINLMRIGKFSSNKFRFLEAFALKNLSYINDAKNIFEELLEEKDVREELVIKELLEIYLNSGKFEQARELVEKRLKNDQTNVAKFIRARLLEYEGNIDEAVSIYEELENDEELKIESLHRLFFLANIYSSEEQIKKYEEKIRELPKFHIAPIINLALYYDMNNKPKESVKLIDTFSGLYSSRVNYLLSEIKNSNIMFLNEDIERQKKYIQKLSEIPIDATGLSIKTRNILIQKGIKTIGDIVKYTEADIQSISTLGEAGVKEIKDLLAGLNLQFAEVKHIETEEEKRYIALLNQSISNVYWTPQARSFLDRNNIKVWGDLVNLKEEDISKRHDVTPSILNEIKQKLLQQGLMFKS